MRACSLKGSTGAKHLPAAIAILWVTFISDIGRPTLALA